MFYKIATTSIHEKLYVEVIKVESLFNCQVENTVSWQWVARAVVYHYTLSRKKKEKCANLGSRPRFFVRTENGTRSFWRLNRILIHALKLKLRHFRHLSGPIKIFMGKPCSLLVKELDSDAEDPGSSPGCSPGKFFFSLLF